MFHRRKIIYACSTLIDLAVAGLIFAFSRRAAELGASAAALGVLGAAWAGIYTFAALVTGPISDRYGRAALARTGVAACIVSALGFASTTAIPGLIAWSCLLGIGLACFWPPIIAWLSEGAAHSGELNARLSNFSIAWTIGHLIGFGQTGWLFRHWPSVAFYVPAGAFAVVLFLLFLPHRVDATPAASGAAAIVIPKGRGFRKTAWIANFALSFTFGGVGALFPQLATHLNIAADVHGGLMAFARGAGLVVFIALQHLAFWRTRLWPLWVAQAVAVIGVAWIGWTTATWTFAVAFALLGAVTSYTYQASIYFTLEEVAGKGTGGGIHEAILASGFFLGPLLAGWVGQHWSLRAPYWFCALALAVMIVAQMVLVFFRRRATVPA